MVRAAVGMEDPDDNPQFLTPALAAQLDRALAPSRAMAAHIDRALAPSRAMAAHIDRALAPSRATLSMLARANTDELRALKAGAHLFKTFDAAGILRDEASALLEDPSTWLAETEEAAETGDERARNALLLVRYLFGCFLLVVHRLDPSARTIERLGPLAALVVFLTVVIGTTNTNNPRLLDDINRCLGTPLGIVALYLAFRPLRDGRRVRYKQSKPLRGNSKPTKRKLHERR